MEPDVWLDHWSGGDPVVATRFRHLTPNDAASLMASQGLPDAPATDFESLENRVYGFGEGDAGVVVKFYRPGRWSLPALQDEAAFVQALLDAGLPVLRPRTAPATWQGIHFVLLDRVWGDRTQLEDREVVSADEARDLGEMLAALHDVGAEAPAPHRLTWAPRPVLEGNLRYLEREGAIPQSLRPQIRSVIKDLIDVCEARFAGVAHLRIHGDCGMNNLLWPTSGPVLMDFDDFGMGPAMQDLLVLDFGYRIADDPATDRVRLNPEPDDALLDAYYAARRRVRGYLLEGYRRRRPIDDGDDLVEPLMLMRQVWFDAWRWARRDDPAFTDVHEQFGSAERWRWRLRDLHHRLRRLTL